MYGASDCLIKTRYRIYKYRLTAQEHNLQSIILPAIFTLTKLSIAVATPCPD